jgi:hypothetical protein
MLQGSTLVVQFLAYSYPFVQILRLVENDDHILFYSKSKITTKNSELSTFVSINLGRVSLKLREVRREVSRALLNAIKLVLSVGDSIRISKDVI